MMRLLTVSGELAFNMTVLVNGLRFNFFSKHCQLSVELIESTAKKACAATSFVGQQSGHVGRGWQYIIKRANSKVFQLIRVPYMLPTPSFPCLGKPLALCTPWNLAPETFSYSICLIGCCISQ